jgi:hypothetical protein
MNTRRRMEAMLNVEVMPVAMDDADKDDVYTSEEELAQPLLAVYWCAQACVCPRAGACVCVCTGTHAGGGGGEGARGVGNQPGGQFFLRVAAAVPPSHSPA